MDLEIKPGGRYVLVSDLHIGDGAVTEAFANKDEPFIDLLRYVAHKADALVIVGDGFDMAQAWTLKRIATGHPKLVAELVRLAHHKPVYYLLGNHDGSSEQLTRRFPLRVGQRLRIGPRILVEHGNSLDPRNMPGDRAAVLGGHVHAALERLIHSPVRIPMRKHYYWSTRLGHWLFYRYGLYRAAKAKLYRRLDQPAKAEHCYDFLDYWGRGEWGDIHGILAGVQTRLADPALDVLICGHSHQAGRVLFDTGTYINTGSWTHGDATYVEYDDGRFSVRDWIKGTEITDDEYRGILGPHKGKSFFDWWSAFYLGWFRYDVPAMQRAAAGDPLSQSSTNLPEDAVAGVEANLERQRFTSKTWYNPAPSS